MNTLPPINSPNNLNSAFYESIDKNAKNLIASDNHFENQLKIYKEEIRRKDALILQLSSLSNQQNNDASSRSRSRDGLNKDLTANQHEKNIEIRMKIHDLEEKIKTNENEIKVLTDCRQFITELNNDLKSENHRLTDLLEQSANRVEELEKDQEDFNNMRQRNELAVSALQSDLNEDRNEIVSLQSKMAMQSELYKKTIDEKTEQTKLLTDHLRMAANIVGCDLDGMKSGTNDDEDSDQNLTHSQLDIILEQIKKNQINLNELIEKNTHLSTQLEDVNITEKANRETINRMASEIAAAEKQTEFDQSLLISKDSEISKWTSKSKELEEIIETIKIENRSLTLELSDKTGTLEKQQSNIQSTSSELNEIKANLQEKDNQIQEFLKIVQNGLGKLDDDKPNADQLPVMAWYFNELIGKYAASQQHLNSLKKSLNSNEQTIKEDSDQRRELENQFRMSQLNSSDLLDKLQMQQRDLSSTQLIIDGINSEKEQMYKYFEKLSQIMKMDEINLDLGLEEVGEALLVRAKQLCNHDAENRAEIRAQNSSLRKQVKELREQIEAKDLHMDLLRKKLTHLEQYHADKTRKSQLELKKETDCERKLAKHADLLELQLEAMRQETVSLKSQLVDQGNMQLVARDQNNELNQLRAAVDKLEKTRQTQCEMLESLKAKLGDKDANWKQTKERLESVMKAISEELEELKKANDDLAKKEHQLKDFRAVVCRLLGLDFESLRIPDFEIITRLERLIQAHNSNVFTAHSVEQNLRNLEKCGHCFGLNTVSTAQLLAPPCYSNEKLPDKN